MIKDHANMTDIQAYLINLQSKLRATDPTNYALEKLYSELGTLHTTLTICMVSQSSEVLEDTEDFLNDLRTEIWQRIAQPTITDPIP